MKGFIEVTRIQDGVEKKAAVSLSNIKCFEESGSHTFIIFGGTLFRNKKPWDAYGVEVTENYDEVVAKIKAATE